MAIKKRVIKKWAKEEEKFLIENAHEKTVRELADITKTNPIQIGWKLHKMGLKPKRVYRRWTSKELQILSTEPIAIAASKMNISPQVAHCAKYYYLRENNFLGT